MFNIQFDLCEKSISFNILSISEINGGKTQNLINCFSHLQPTYQSFGFLNVAENCVADLKVSKKRAMIRKNNNNSINCKAISQITHLILLGSESKTVGNYCFVRFKNMTHAKGSAHITPHIVSAELCKSTRAVTT